VFQKVKTLFLNLAVYGMGDVATHLVSFLLLPVFTRFLDPQSYGIWQLLLTASLIAKILFRWGVDASFMRFFYECEDEGARQRLASTIFFFLLGANGVILLVALLLAPVLIAVIHAQSMTATGIPVSGSFSTSNPVM